MIRLHTHPFSTFARRVKIALLEKNIPHEEVFVDLAKRQQKTPAYLALNPYARVPTLEEDGFVLYESSAILMYLEDEHPEPALVPAGAKGRAEVDMHLRLCDSQMAGPAGVIIFQKRFFPEAKWNLEAIKKASADIAKHLVILDKQLRESWLAMAGERLGSLPVAPRQPPEARGADVGLEQVLLEEHPGVDVRPLVEHQCLGLAVACCAIALAQRRFRQ